MEKSLCVLFFSLLESFTVGERLSSNLRLSPKASCVFTRETPPGSQFQSQENVLVFNYSIQSRAECSILTSTRALNGFEKVLFFSDQRVSVFQVSLRSVVYCDSKTEEERESFSEISACVLEGNSQVFYEPEYTHFQTNGLISQSTARERRGTLRSASSNASKHVDESASP